MNNPDSSTMFAHIVSRLTNRTEDVAVEALGFILSRSDAARRALRDLLKVEGLDVGELTDAGTQVGDETLARPDLAIYDRERKERVLIEAKFWAGLTENQPNAYLARLPLDERPAVLLFVAPEARLETLWPELRRLIEPPFGWQPVETSHDTEIKCALVDAVPGARELARTAQPHAVIRHVFRRFHRGRHPATARPLRTAGSRGLPAAQAARTRAGDPASDASVQPACRRCGRTGQRARYRQYGQAERNAAPSRLWTVPAPGQQGSRCPGAWFGVDHTLWARSRETPLWITFHYWDGVITVDELRDRLGNDIWANTPDSIPFHLPTGVEYDKVLADVVERLVSITTQIAAEEAP